MPDRGYTLVELLVALGILSIATATLVPAYSLERRVAARAAGYQLAADLRLARQLAVAGGSPCALQVDAPDQYRFTCVARPPVKLPAGLRLVPPGPLPWQFAYSPDGLLAAGGGELVVRPASGEFGWRIHVTSGSGQVRVVGPPSS